MPLDEVEAVNWRGVATLAIVTAVNVWLYGSGLVAVPFVTCAPMTFVLYVALSLVFRRRVRARCGQGEDVCERCEQEEGLRSRCGQEASEED